MTGTASRPTSVQSPSLRKKVALACRILGNAGLADFLGHVSARVPGTDRVLIRARGLDAGSMASTSEKEVLDISLDGKARGGASRLRPPIETPIHTQVYLARKDVFSVVHVHARAPVVFSLVDLPILPVFNQGIELAAEGVPVYPRNGLVATRQEGDELASTLGRKMSCILYAHGIVTVGRTVEEATVRALRLDRIAKMNLYARLIGEPKPAPPGGLRVDMAAGEAETGGEWNYQVGLLKGAGRGRR